MHIQTGCVTMPELQPRGGGRQRPGTASPNQGPWDALGFRPGTRKAQRKRGMGWEGMGSAPPIAEQDLGAPRAWSIRWNGASECDVWNRHMDLHHLRRSQPCRVPAHPAWVQEYRPAWVQDGSTRENRNAVLYQDPNKRIFCNIRRFTGFFLPNKPAPVPTSTLPH
jgi:hypothetical protein